MTTDEKYMQRAVELARHGAFYASPNPMVGAVIVADGRIIGEGYHRRVGEGHAEVNAIASVSDADRHLLSDSTMYVTLEPCSHYGRTPPCAKLIIDTGIPRVVVGISDPFAKVAGRGIAMLRDAGVEVTVGVCADACTHLNERFLTAHTLKRPFITLKWAQSADGYMSAKGDGRVIFSTPQTAVLMHRERALNDAILVGSGTVIADKPSLTTRLWTGRSPQPVVLDRRHRLTPEQLPENTWVYDDYKDLRDVVADLYARGITSLMVEGGPTVLKSFMRAGLYDRIRRETSLCTLGDHGAAEAPKLIGKPYKVEKIDGNTIEWYEKTTTLDNDNFLF